MTTEEREFLLNDSILRVPTSKQTSENRTKIQDLSPTTLTLVQVIGDMECKRMLRILLDSGGTYTLFNKRAIPQGAKVLPISNPTSKTTVAGNFIPKEKVRIRDLYLPELNKSKKYYGGTFVVFDRPYCPHDTTIGRDLLHELGIVFNFKQICIQMDDKIVPMKTSSHWLHHTNWTMTFDSNYINANYNQTHFIDKDDSFILDAKYKATSAKEVGTKQKHLTKAQQDQLVKPSPDTQVLFDGKLGDFKHAKIHLDVDPNALPVHAWPYSIPHAHDSAFVKELKNLLEVGVLERVPGPTEWASPTFTIPKKMDEFGGFQI